MKIRTLASCLAVGLWILAQPAIASEKSDLEKKGLASLTGEEIANIYVGKTCSYKTFDAAGELIGNGENVYKEDGTIIKTLTKVGGSPDTRNRKWWMDGSSFCETLYRTDEPWCDAHKSFFRLEDKLYMFHKNGAIWFELTCP